MERNKKIQINCKMLWYHAYNIITYITYHNKVLNRDEYFTSLLSQMRYE